MCETLGLTLPFVNEAEEKGGEGGHSRVQGCGDISEQIWSHPLVRDRSWQTGYDKVLLPSILKSEFIPKLIFLSDRFELMACFSLLKPQW